VSRRTLATIAAVFAAFAVVGILGGIWLARGLAETANAGHDAACDTRFGTTCDSIPLEKLQEAFDVTFPEGTVVVDSSYQQFQDWNLEATLTITDPSFELPEIWSESGPDADGVYRTATFEDAGGDTRTLKLRMNTT